MGAPAEQREMKCAVRMPDCADDANTLENYLREQGVVNAARFAPKDDDELNDAVCSRRYQRVIFLKLDDLLDAIWTGHIEYNQWIALGVKIDLVLVPFPGPVDWPRWIEKTTHSLNHFRRRQKKRQTTAAVILSLLALAAIAALFYWLPRNR